MTHAAACLTGALVADAAALGLHWIYDPARIAKVAGSTPAFTPIRAAHYDGVPSYFAHGARRDGQLSQYGECLALALDCCGADGFDPAAYQTAFAAFFGPGGAYQGYIDRPTRGTLDNITAGQTDPSGVTDDQHPAITRLPLIAVLYGTMSDYANRVATSIRVTNDDATALEYGQICADLLAMVLAGVPLRAALAQSARTPVLQAALETSETDSTAYGEVTKRACHLPQGVPLAFHILTHADSYAEAVDRNILAGGDSCGRAMLIGAVMGAVHGIATPKGIPLGHILNTTDMPRLWPLIQKMTNS